MLVIVVAVLAFITIGGIGWVFVGGDSGSARAAKRAQAIVSGGPRETRARGRAAVANTQESRRKQILQTLKDQERQQKKATLAIAARLQQAGLSVSVRTFWIASIVFGLGLGLLVLVATQKPLIALGLAFAAGLGLPRWLVGFLAKRRIKMFTEAFSDAIDIIVRGIKSGLPVHDCLKIIGRECPEPLAGEFRRMVENVGMGMAMDQSLEKMYERMPTNELRFFSIVLAIQQKAGGNLAEALNNLSTILRARKMMREKIKALSSEAIASSFIIGSLPPGVVAMISLTNPAYMAPMFSDPRGHLMLLGAAIWMSLGILVMRNMINFKF